MRQLLIGQAFLFFRRVRERHLFAEHVHIGHHADAGGGFVSRAHSRQLFHLLPVKTIGGIVTTAQPVVGIVPEGTPLEVNAIVMNKDVGYVREGQRCVVKVDTYDFQKYGTI